MVTQSIPRSVHRQQSGDFVRDHFRGAVKGVDMNLVLPEESIAIASFIASFKICGRSSVIYLSFRDGVESSHVAQILLSPPLRLEIQSLQSCNRIVVRRINHQV